MFSPRSAAFGLRRFPWKNNPCVDPLGRGYGTSQPRNRVFDFERILEKSHEVNGRRSCTHDVLAAGKRGRAAMENVVHKQNPAPFEFTCAGEGFNPDRLPFSGSNIVRSVDLSPNYVKFRGR